MANFQFVDGVFNLGTDLSVSVVDNDTNLPISLAGRLITFKADPKTAYVASLPIDNLGLPQHRTVPQGWTITMSIERYQGDLDSLQALMESNFYNQGKQKYFTVSQQTRNQNNSQVDTYNFLYCAGSMETSGEYKNADKVLVNFKFECQQRQPG